MRFIVKLGKEIVGFSELESGDPPMGEAFGRFVPTAAYKSIQKHWRTRPRKRSSVHLHSVLVKPSAKAEIERLQELAKRSARLRQEADALQAKSEQLHSKVEKVHKRVAQLGLKQKTTRQ